MTASKVLPLAISETVAFLLGVSGLVARVSDS